MSFLFPYKQAETLFSKPPLKDSSLAGCKGVEDPTSLALKKVLTFSQCSLLNDCWLKKDQDFKEKIGSSREDYTNRSLIEQESMHVCT